MSRGGTRRSAPWWSTTQRRVPTRTYDPVEVIAMAAGVQVHDARHLGPAHQQLMDLLGGGSLTIVETAHHFGLPVQQIRLLVSDLSEEGLISMREPARPAAGSGADAPDETLLRRVIDGLRGLSA